VVAGKFTGFGEHAVDFYDGLVADNSKAYWTDNREIYESDVRVPMQALLDDLMAEFGDFGTSKIFRPYRDVRFAKDKTPYKTNQGAFVGVGPACGWYIEIAARGVRTGAGFYDAGAADLGRIRAAIADEIKGKQLQKILTKLERAGFEIGGDRLKTAPRGYDVEHPRIELLRHRSLTVMKDYGFEPIIHTAELLDAVRSDWKATRPLIDWISARLE
jgi:uncharacterized protein (TIGR02453 family)